MVLPGFKRDLEPRRGLVYSVVVLDLHTSVRWEYGGCGDIRGDEEEKREERGVEVFKCQV